MSSQSKVAGAVEQDGESLVGQTETLDLPKLGGLTEEHFDAVIVGTGLTESILSAAMALSGKKVLHLDHNDFYGGNQATVNVKQVEEMSVSRPDEIRGGSLDIDCKEERNFCLFAGSPLVNPEMATEWATIRNDNSCTRWFNIDTSPRLVFCRGETVDMLVESGVSKYVEFKPLEDVLLLDAQDEPIQVPFSKAAVFKSKNISMGEKRQLMRFFQDTMDRATKESAGGKADAVMVRNEENLNQGRSLARPQNKPEKEQYELDNNSDFTAFLSGPCKLSDRLKDCIMYAVALLPKKPHPGEISTRNGMERVQRYLAGLGRFGKTAFLCPMYGTSELTQAFCRLSSVYGTYFILRHRLQSLQVEDNKVRKLVLGNGEAVSTDRVIASSSFGLDKFLPVGNEYHPESYEVVKTCIVNGPILALLPTVKGKDSEEVLKLLRASAVEGHPRTQRVHPDLARSLLIIPPDHSVIGNQNPIRVVQLDHSVEASAPGTYLITLSMMSPSKADGRIVLEKGFNHLLEKARITLDQLCSPKVPLTWLWEASFVKRVFSNTRQVEGMEGSVISVPDVEFCLDTSAYVSLAKELFHSMFPGESFLVPPVDQQDFDGDEQTSFIERVKVPQPVDLRWFTFLSGELSPGTRNIKF
eukprot:CAMPEP_0203762076 /NCGR_PEP_ID=MMETSP0098-20131031/15033_1 /ASSEMBLY_ACC=CAM_ASM_000208 /TAXON_ID=96639 /ORGANISM=" , Strain NY0313808BC1" /LENGTH=640 /DNA_ID=CAMNT_0050656337 /DNA_START=1057 /DNA_END=2979 /DNA_ORIENTATION=-